MESKLPKRNEVPAALTWDLTDIYADEKEWEADADRAMALAEEIAGMEGRAAADAGALLKVMKRYAD